MPYISLTKAKLKEKEISDDTMKSKPDQTEKVFRHPVRNRILYILRDGEPKTQRELGKLLSMSNAAIHYHIKLLEDVGIVRLHSTRPGPNGITEKLYMVDIETWPDVTGEDVAFYLDYTVSWMKERHREGLNILKQEHDIPFLAGSFTVRAPQNEIIRFKRNVEKMFNAFFLKYKEIKEEDSASFGVTFSILPSSRENEEDSQNVLEFEP